MRRTPVWLAACVFFVGLACGCEPASDDPADSGGPPPDAGAVLPDADVSPDAEELMPDRALPPDLGGPVPDAALPPDAGEPPLDAAPPPDAALPDPDAAPRPDAAIPDPDAARPAEPLPEAGPFCASNVCPPEPDCVECADELVFVDAAAEPGGDGTRARPFRRIGPALDLAEARGGAAVVVAVGRYEETIGLPDGVSIHGGFGPEWRRGAGATEFRGVEPDGDQLTAVRAVDILRGAGLDQVTLTTVDGGPGVTTSGVLARRASALILHEVIARPGRGGDGQAGRDGAPGTAGGDGSDAEVVLEDIGCRLDVAPGGGGHNNACPVADGGRGGRQAGPPGPPAAQCDDPPCPPAGGVAGAAGDDGLTSFLAPLVEGEWRGVTGDSGEPGHPATGNRGQAGGLVEGARGRFAAGGGGGAGGCGGTAGTGGGPGGASFGLFAVDSPGLRVRASDLAGGSGGVGGAGGLGGAGGAGGADGVSLDCRVSQDRPEWHDCHGEIGPCEPTPGRVPAMHGGDGGAGGRGADGVSAGVLCVGGDLALDDATVLAAGEAAHAATDYGCCVPDEAAAEACEADGGQYDAGRCICRHADLCPDFPQPEVCNGLDDDCDGRIDAALARREVPVNAPWLARFNARDTWIVRLGAYPTETGAYVIWSAEDQAWPELDPSPTGFWVVYLDADLVPSPATLVAMEPDASLTVATSGERALLAFGGWFAAGSLLYVAAPGEEGEGPRVDARPAHAAAVTLAPAAQGYAAALLDDGLRYAPVGEDGEVGDATVLAEQAAGPVAIAPVGGGHAVLATVDGRPQLFVVDAEGVAVGEPLAFDPIEPAGRVRYAAAAGLDEGAVFAWTEGELVRAVFVDAEGRSGAAHDLGDGSLGGIDALGEQAGVRMTVGRRGLMIRFDADGPAAAVESVSGVRLADEYLGVTLRDGRAVWAQFGLLCALADEIVAEGMPCGPESPPCAVGTFCVGDVCAVRRCGDGVRAGNEACDDGDEVEDDGCTSECLVGRVAVGHPCAPDGPECVDGSYCDDVCTAHRCGDGLLAEGEACDDGNDIEDDGCTSLCESDALGEGRPCAGAERPCDRDTWCPEGADAVCTAHLCGDGHQTGPEGCDDANDDDADGCTAACECTLGPQQLPPPADGAVCEASEDTCGRAPPELPSCPVVACGIRPATPEALGDEWVLDLDEQGRTRATKAWRWIDNIDGEVIDETWIVVFDAEGRAIEYTRDIRGSLGNNLFEGVDCGFDAAGRLEYYREHSDFFGGWILHCGFTGDRVTQVDTLSGRGRSRTRYAYEDDRLLSRGDTTACAGADTPYEECAREEVTYRYASTRLAAEDVAIFEAGGAEAAGRRLSHVGCP